MQAALTGHFVMSSLHATDATSALHRFMDMGIEPFLVASSLLGVVGQRLVRKMCPNCVQPYEPTPDERAFYERGGGDPDKTTSSTARAATSAARPATTTAAASTKCWPSPTS